GVIVGTFGGCESPHSVTFGGSSSEKSQSSRRAARIALRTRGVPRSSPILGERRRGIKQQDRQIRHFSDHLSVTIPTSQKTWSFAPGESITRAKVSPSAPPASSIRHLQFRDGTRIDVQFGAALLRPSRVFAQSS